MDLLSIHTAPAALRTIRRSVPQKSTSDSGELTKNGALWNDVWGDIYMDRMEHTYITCFRKPTIMH